MNGITTLFSKLSRSAMKCKPIAKVMVKASHNKPEIFAIAGGISVIASFVLAIRAGTKVKETMAVTADKVSAVEAKQKERRENEYHLDEDGKLIGEQNEVALVKLEKKELTQARAEGVWEVVKLFALPSGLLVMGLALITKGHVILKRRNIVLAGTLKGTQEMLKFYRENVIADQGKDADLKYMRGVLNDKEIESVVVDENGKETKVKQRVPVVRRGKNPWRFEFSETFFNSWIDDVERNLFFLKCEQDWWNHEFDRNGEVSMYEVLKHLGYKFEVEKAGLTPKQYRERMTFLRNFGWRKGCGGDDYIDFGLYRAINEAAISRKSDVVYVEFNCDGDLGNLTELNIK